MLLDFNDKVIFAIIDDIDYNTVNEQSFDDGLILILGKSLEKDELVDIINAVGLENYEYITPLVRHNAFLLE